MTGLSTAAELVKVVVADDSLVMRTALRSALSRDMGVEIAAVTATGEEAKAAVAEHDPDVVVLDVDMPGLDGSALAVLLLAERPDRPVLLFSALDESRAADAVAAGARFVAKPTTKSDHHGMVEQLRTVLLPQVLKAATHKAGSARRTRESLRAAAKRQRTAFPPKVVVIGTSTGGPIALDTVMAHLEVDVPVLVVQHLPHGFDERQASRMRGVSKLPVEVAQDDCVLEPGKVLLAPADRHLQLEQGKDGQVRTRLADGPPVNYCRPAVDPLLFSAADLFGDRVLAVVLTGMGRDGADGAAAVAAGGGTVLVQDEATSMVWGMPGAVVNDGVRAEVLPLPKIADRINSAFR